MAERHDRSQHDGRFGEKFDDELNVPSVIWVTVGIAVVTALGFLVAWWLYHALIGKAEATAAVPPPVVAKERVERRLPPGPLLQASPEEELIEMRREMEELLHGYGWVDEGQGIVHVPIDKAIDLVLEGGLSATAAPAAETEAVAPAEEVKP